MGLFKLMSELLLMLFILVISIAVILLGVRYYLGVESQATGLERISAALEDGP